MSDKPDQMRERILEAAKRLLRRHGHDKLTVVDIARSLQMSHANVYRYFQTKAEILDAITNDWLAKIEAFVEAIAARPESAAQRLEDVVLELHLKRKQKLLEDAEVFETYRRVAELRPDVVAKRRETILNVFWRLIEEGVQAGEFSVSDSTAAANALKDATSLFLNPMLIPSIITGDSAARARAVVRYMLAGFARCHQPPGRQSS